MVSAIPTQQGVKIPNPVTNASVCVVVPVWNQVIGGEVKQFIRQLNSQQNNSDPKPSVQCLVLNPTKKNHSTSDKAITIRAVTPSSNHTRLVKGTYYFAKQWVDTVMPALCDNHPELFQIKNTPYNLGDAFEYTLQLDIARQGAERLLGVIEALEAASAHAMPDTLYWHPDCYFIQQATCDWLQSEFPQLASMRMAVLPRPVFSGIQRVVRQTVLDTTLHLKTWKYAFQSLFSSPSKPNLSQSNAEGRRALTFARSDHHLRVLEPSLATFKTHGHVVFANFIRDSIRQRHPHLVSETFGEYGSVECIEPRDVPLRPELLASIRCHVLQQLQSASTDVIAERKALVAQLLTISKQFCRLDALSARYHPTDILACMEADAFGLYFKELKKTYGYTLWNHLHGIAPYFYNQHLFAFDTFFVWNQLTADIEVADGYPDDGSLKVVGTPFWEGQRPLNEQLTNPDKVAQLKEWKGYSPLIGAYTAPPGIGYIDVPLRTAYLDSLCNYLANRSNVKLLIKKHPNESDGVSEAVIQRRTDVADRITLQGASELALYDSLYLVDVATAICSSVLMEALFYDVPTLAMDTTDMTRRLGYGMEKMMPVALTDAQAHQWLDDILAQGIVHPAYQVNDKQYYLPHFNQAYAQRVQAIIG